MNFLLNGINCFFLYYLDHLKRETFLLIRAKQDPVRLIDQLMSDQDSNHVIKLLRFFGKNCGVHNHGAKVG